MINGVFAEYDSGDGKPVTCRLLSFVVRSDDRTYAVVSILGGQVFTVSESAIRVLSTDNKGVMQ